MANYAAVVSSVIATITLIGIGYKAGLQGKWIVNGPIAKAIAEEVMAIEERERLEFQLEYKRSQLRSLRRTPKEDRTEEELDEIDDLKEQIALIKRRLGQTAPKEDPQEE